MSRASHVLFSFCLVLTLCSAAFSQRIETLDGVVASRALKASASASSSATAVSTGGYASAESEATAISEGGADAVANSIANAFSEGGVATARSVVEAIADAMESGLPIDAIAEGIAEATALDKDQVKDYLLDEDTEALAEVIVSSQGGYAYGEATSIAEAVARSTDVVVEAVENVFAWANRGRPVFAIVNREAVAIGEAVAEVYTDAAVVLEVEGEGTAYGVAEASAEAISEAFAKVILKGIARAANKFGVALAKFKGEAVSRALAEAATSAFVEGSLDGSGYVEATQTSVARAVALPVASILVDAVAYAYEGSTTSSVYIEADSGVSDDEEAVAHTTGSVDVDGDGEGAASGSADAGTFQATPCTGQANRCCSNRNARQTRCNCRRGRCRFESAIRENGKTTHWKDTYSQDVCYC